MKKKILVLGVALALVAALAVPMSVMAATTAGVTVTATPSYVSIGNVPDTAALGTVGESTTVWAGGSTPADPLVDGGCTYTVTNDGSVEVDITIKATDFAGGVNWTLAGTVGENIVVMKAGKSGDDHSAMITLTTSEQPFISDLAAAATKKWEFSLGTGTFTDGVEKTSTITLTATDST